MKAVQYSGHGGGAAALKHVEVPIPSPDKFEVLLKLEATSLNPVDWKIQKGNIPFFPRKYPHIPASDLAGEVVQVGSEVKDFKAGDKVVAYRDGFSGGGLAEYAVTKETLTTIRPPEVSAVEAASLPVAGLTAHQALSTAGITFDGSGPRKNVLVTAASGGVGHYAVQLAKLGNNHVTATCGARNIELVKSLGADKVLDYKTPEGAALKSQSGKTYDAVVNASGNSFSAIQPNLSAEAKVIELTPGPRVFLNYALKKLTFSKQQVIPVFAAPNRQNLEFLLKLATEGKLKTVIDSKYPLSKAEDGWAKSMSGRATGKIVIEP